MQRQRMLYGFLHPDSVSVYLQSVSSFCRQSSLITTLLYWKVWLSENMYLLELLLLLMLLLT